MTYCGNNKYNSDIISGIKVIGTRYECIKKGIGIGFNSPPDPDYSGKYEPIVVDNFYCGDKNPIPNKYDRLGTNPQCLSRGIGIGKRLKHSRRYESFGFNNIISINYIYVFLLFIVISSYFITICFYIKPYMLIEKKDNIVVIIWWKLIIFSFGMSILTIFIILLFYKICSNVN